MAARTISNIPIISGILLALLNFILTTPVGIHGFSIRLVPIASLFPKNLTLEEWHHNLVEISKTRALLHQQSSMIMRSSTTALTLTNSAMNLTKEIAPDAILRPSMRRSPLGYYMAQVSIGSKPFSTYMMIDSGSDTSWVQCEGCQICFPVSGSGNFKYKQSQSFQYLPCVHPLCSPRLCDQRGFCRYKIEYVSSSTEGMMLTDSFTFTSSSRTTEKYNGLAFGCGLVNDKISFGKPNNNLIAGIMGLGSGRNSILVQLESQTKRRFSYCLPPLDAPTSLLFGDDAKFNQPLSRVQVTRLVPGVSNYFVLEVVGISIEQKFLKINPDVFRLKQDRGGFVMDSGSPYSCIVQSAYDAIREEMVKYFMRRNGLRADPPGGLFDLCYTMATTPRKNYVLPSMTFHFRGANLVLKPDAVFRSYGATKCLAILRNNERGPSIFGAYQQTNHRFLFDGSQYMMAFAPENCA